VTQYKILRLDNQRKHPLQGNVWSNNETWNSLEDALNELGAAGWEINLPVYGPVPGGRDHQGDSWMEALILENKICTASDDLDRRIAKVKEIIEEAKHDLENTPEGSPKYLSAKSQIQMSSKYLEKLLDEKKN